MKNPGWLIQVYEMSDVAAQKAAADLLSDIHGFTVDARTCERGAFLIVECEDASRALFVYETVVMDDPNAELIHSTSGAAEPGPVRS